MVTYLKERIELLFKLLMSIFLIYVFNPYRKPDIKLEFEHKFLLYAFGFVLIFTANWHKIIMNSVFYKKRPEKKSKKRSDSESDSDSDNESVGGKL
jgi:hypothetical protein